MSLEHLTPMPWYAVPFHAGGNVQPFKIEIRGNPVVLNGHILGSEPICSLFSGFVGFESNAEFLLLARAAFDVMTRRGWYPAKVGHRWGVVKPTHMVGTLTGEPITWPDPFTALVEADAWMKENVEKTKEDA